MTAAIKKGITFAAFIGSMWVATKLPIRLVPPLHMVTPVAYVVITWLLFGLYLLIQPRQPFTNRFLAVSWTLFHVSSTGVLAAISLLWLLAMLTLFSSVPQEVRSCEQQVEYLRVRYSCIVIYEDYYGSMATFESILGLPLMLYIDADFQPVSLARGEE